MVEMIAPGPTDVTPRGSHGLFTSPQLNELLAVLDQVRNSAQAA